MPRILYVHIMTNAWHTVLYTGVTNDLVRRIVTHRNRLDSGSFTARYHLWKLVY